MDIGSDKSNPTSAHDGKAVEILNSDSEKQAAEALEKLSNTKPHGVKRKSSSNDQQETDHELESPLKKGRLLLSGEFDNTVLSTLGMSLLDIDRGQVPDFKKFTQLLTDNLLKDGQIWNPESNSMPSNPQLNSLQYRDTNGTWATLMEVVKRIGAANDGRFPNSKVIYKRPHDQKQIPIEGTIDECVESMYQFYYPKSGCVKFRDDSNMRRMFSGVEDAYLVMCCLNHIHFSMIDQARFDEVKSLEQKEQLSTELEQQQHSQQQPATSKSLQPVTPNPSKTLARSSQTRKTPKHRASSKPPSSKSKSTTSAKTQSGDGSKKKKKSVTVPAGRTTSVRLQIQKALSQSCESSQQSEQSSEQSQVKIQKHQTKQKQQQPKQQEQPKSDEERKDQRAQETKQQQADDAGQVETTEDLCVPVSGRGRLTVSNGLQETKQSEHKSEQDGIVIVDVDENGSIPEQPQEIDLSYTNMRTALAQFHGTELQNDVVYYMVAPTDPRHELPPVYSFVLINTDAFKQADTPPSQVPWPCEAACIFCLLAHGKNYAHAYFTFPTSRATSNVMKHIHSKHGHLAEVRFISFRPHPERILDHAVILMALSMEVPLDKLTDVQVLRGLGFHFQAEMLAKLNRSLLASLADHNELASLVEEEATQMIRGLPNNASLFVSSQVTSFDRKRGKCINLLVSSYDIPTIVFGIVVFHELMQEPSLFMSTDIWKMVRERAKSGNIIFSDLLSASDFVDGANSQTPIRFFPVPNEMVNLQQHTINIVQYAAKVANDEQKGLGQEQFSVSLLFDVFNAFIERMIPCGENVLDFFSDDHDPSLALPECKEPSSFTHDQLPHQDLIRAICSDFKFNRRQLSAMQYNILYNLERLSRDPAIPESLLQSKLCDPVINSGAFKHLSEDQKKFIRNNVQPFIQLVVPMVAPLINLTDKPKSHSNLFGCSAVIYSFWKSIHAITLPQDSHTTLSTFQDEILGRLNSLRESTVALLETNSPTADQLVQFLCCAFNPDSQIDPDSNLASSQLQHDVLRLLSMKSPNTILKQGACSQPTPNFAPRSENPSQKEQSQLSLLVSFVNSLESHQWPDECPQIDDYVTMGGNVRSWWSMFGSIPHLFSESLLTDEDASKHLNWVKYLIAGANGLDGTQNQGFARGNNCIAYLAWFKANLSWLGRIDMSPRGL